jgi:hypothetical protein
MHNIDQGATSGRKPGRSLGLSVFLGSFGLGGCTVFLVQ